MGVTMSKQETETRVVEADPSGADRASSRPVRKQDRPRYAASRR